MLDFCPSSTKAISKVSCPNSTLIPREILGTVQGHGYYHNFQSASQRPPILTPPMPIRAILLVLLKCYLNNISHGIMRTLLRIFLVLDLLLYITLLVMVLTWPSVQYPINVASIIGIWTINCLIPPTDVELMGGHRRTSEEY